MEGPAAARRRAPRRARGGAAAQPVGFRAAGFFSPQKVFVQFCGDRRGLWPRQPPWTPVSPSASSVSATLKRWKRHASSVERRLVDSLGLKPSCNRVATSKTDRASAICYGGHKLDINIIGTLDSHHMMPPPPPSIGARLRHPCSAYTSSAWVPMRTGRGRKCS